MKKSLVSALTTAFVVGASATAFAAANPFEDVPADHWAYDAVAQLAADGIIEGYGDGTYRGDQEITRYEMAQMIARAMTKGATGADKSLVDKLAAEFSDELSSLGVRVANLEKKVDNVKWGGEVRYRYISERHKENRGTEDPEKSNSQYVTLRLEPEMRVNKHWTGHARIDYNTNMDTAKNTTGSADDIETDGVRVERVWAQGDYDNFQILLGKLPYLTNVDGGMLFDDNVSGGQITVGSKVKATITIGRANHEPDDGVYTYEAGTDDEWTENAASSYQGIELYSDPEENKFTWGVGYHRFANKTHFKRTYGEKNRDAMNIWDVGLGYQFSDHIGLSGAYAWNTAAREGKGEVGHGAKRAWSVELNFGESDPEEKGSWGAFVAYRKLGDEAVWAPTYDAIGAGQKGWEVGVDYAFAKNIQGIVKYFNGKDMASDKDASTIFTELNFFF